VAVVDRFDCIIFFLYFYSKHPAKLADPAAAPAPAPVKDDNNGDQALIQLLQAQSPPRKKQKLSKKAMQL
jgi:hypothetical protein